MPRTTDPKESSALSLLCPYTTSPRSQLGLHTVSPATSTRCRPPPHLSWRPPVPVRVTPSETFRSLTSLPPLFAPTRGPNVCSSTPFVACSECCFHLLEGTAQPSSFTPFTTEPGRGPGVICVANERHSKSNRGPHFSKLDPEVHDTVKMKELAQLTVHHQGDISGRYPSPENRAHARVRVPNAPERLLKKALQVVDSRQEAPKHRLSNESPFVSERVRKNNDDPQR